MSKHETPLTRKYWQSVGGTLVEEFQLVKTIRGKQSRRNTDGLIIIGDEYQILKGYADITGKDVICVQTKARRLGMYLLGQALFSKELILKNFNPRSVRTVALCTQNDAALAELAEAYGIEIVIISVDK